MNELTGRELDRAIAVALGYYAQEVPTFNQYADPVYTLYRGRGESVTWAHATSIEAAWDKLTPAFHADANAQLAVCAERGWAMYYDPDGAMVIVFSHEPGNERYYAELHDDDAPRQEVGARALLAALTGESEAAT